MESKMSKPFKRIVFTKKQTILFIAFFVFGFIIMIVISSIQRYQLDNKYPLMKRETEINGVIIGKLNPKCTYITLNNNSYIRVLTLTNTQYKPNYFDFFITYGDSLSKRANSDTLYVYRGGREYYFVTNPLNYAGWE